MKKFILSAIIAVLPAIGFSQSLLETEISIRPLQPGLTVELGVLGTTVELDINGSKIIHNAIFITGETAKAIIQNVNNSLKAAGEVARYTFDASKQMIVITGKGAVDLINSATNAGLDLAKSGIQLADTAARAVLIETKKLANSAAKFVHDSLVSAYTFTRDGAAKAISHVKIVIAETAETINDAAILTYKGMVKAVNFSKKMLIESVDTALVLSKTAVLYVNDTGAFVFNHTKKTIIQIAKYGQNGLELIEEGIEVVLKSVGFIFRSIFSLLPKFIITIN